MMLRRIPPLALLLVLASGCGPSAASNKFYDWTGAVTGPDGKPATRLTMKFEPVDPAIGREDVCLLENGRYTSKLMAGKYKVYFAALPGGTAIPRKYTAPSSSTLEIDASKDGEVNFNLK